MEAAAGVNTKQYLGFKLGREEYGVDIQMITSIIEKNMKIARVPKAPKYILGVINLRGEIIPVMDTRMRLQLSTVEDTENTRIIIVKVEEIVIGMVVDSVAEVIELDDDSIEGLSTFSSDITMDYISGVGKVDNRIVTLLNLENLINKSKQE